MRTLFRESAAADTLLVSVMHINNENWRAAAD